MGQKYATDSLEELMRRQRDIWETDKKYSRLMCIPVTVAVIGLLVIGYNLLSDYKPKNNFKEETVEVVETLTDVKENSSSDASESENKDGKINLNTASAEELDKLPEIGEVLSKRIVELREKMGGYRSVSDLLNVKGIGKATLDKFKDRIYVD